MNGGHNSHHKMEKTKLKSIESDVKTDETFKKRKKVTQPSQWTRGREKKRKKKEKKKHKKKNNKIPIICQVNVLISF